MNQNPISIRVAFTFARKTYQSHYPLFIASMLTFFAAWVLLEITVIAGQKLGMILWVIAHLAFFIVFAGLEVGFIQIGLALVNGQEVSYSILFSKLASGGSFFIGQLLYLSICLVGFVLLIIPGFYWGTQYAMNGFCMVANSTNPTIGLQDSVQLSKKSNFSIFVFIIVIVFLNLLGASLLGVGLLVSVPISVLMKACVFKQLRSYGTG
jgi:hypothetical protein